MYAKGASVSSGDQRRVLDAVIARAQRAGARGVAVFDLDSTLLDNRPRQARILAEYGRAHQLPLLAASRPEHWTSWEIADAMRAAGADEATVAAHRAAAKDYWGLHFFTSAYCTSDVPMPGARDYLAALGATGVQIAYVTGRDLAMGDGTLATFRAAEYPIPDGKRIHLLLKPSTALADDAWKEQCYARLSSLGEVLAAFDNEPTHINGYRARFPHALCVHLATDDSGRPIRVVEGVPSVADFFTLTMAGEHPPGFRARRAQNWVFLGLMYGFFYMSRYNFSAIAARLSDTFGWSNEQYGSILSWGTLIYGLSVFLNGPLADRLGGKRAILIGSAGAAFFNLLFGLCHLFLAQPAHVVKGVVVDGAVYAHGMSNATMLATFAALWAANHYFQSFGALSIVKINAAWFPVRERGVFAGIFGIMIQSGRWLAFAVSPILLTFLPWQWCFWIPSAILCVMWVANRFLVENSPREAGFPDLETGDETKEEAATAGTLAFVLKKVFASPTMWLFALCSMCIGFVRNSIDHWWAKYMPAVFGASSGLPHQIDSFAMPLCAILGGLAAGTASDKIFGSRRGPVVFFGFVGQLLCLLLLARCYQIWWAACALLALVSFFIQSSHSIIGGAASMDFGGKKAVATAAGLFDGAQYLAGAIVSRLMGHLLDHFKDPAHPGIEYRIWPLVPVPFALIGALLVARLWNARPARAATEKPVDAVAVEAVRRVG